MTPQLKNHELRLLGTVGAGAPLCELKVDGARWNKGARGLQEETAGSVGRPLRRALSGCGMTARGQLVLDVMAATGRSVQVIKPFMHSSTRLQAPYADSRAKVPTHRIFCWASFFLLSFLPFSRLAQIVAPLLFFPFFHTDSVVFILSLQIQGFKKVSRSLFNVSQPFLLIQ